ncbi:pyruvate, water dikinase regulatory protein [Mammaliicoccus sciuri]
MEEIRIIIASDSVGETAELVTKACTSQYKTEGNALDIVRLPYIENESNINEVVSLALEQKSIVVYTLVKPEMRLYLKEKLEENNIENVDIMGPLMSILSNELNEAPLNEPGNIHKLDEDYFKKIEAIEFAVKYDDGRDSRGLPKADIILIGVSRTSKTPLSQYLAHKRYKVMNVPLVPEVAPPEGLFEIDPKKCIALKINQKNLNAIRRARLIQLGLSDDANYAKDDRIEEELRYFEEIVGKIGCPVLDVSDKAIEETANDIIKIITQQNR